LSSHPCLIVENSRYCPNEGNGSTLFINPLPAWVGGMQIRRRAEDLGPKVWLIGLVFLTSGAQAAENRLVDTKVTFTASGAGGVKVVGHGTQLLLRVDGPWLVLKVPLRSVTTGLVRRDRELHDKFLEVESYPWAELRLQPEALKMPSKDGAVAGEVSARLTLHGRSRDTTVQYSIKREGATLKVSGKLRVDVRTHGIDLPQARGVALDPEVVVDVGFVTHETMVVANAGQ
jgi:polyisoprenoid-binding protein YceI